MWRGWKRLAAVASAAAALAPAACSKHDDTSATPVKGAPVRPVGDVTELHRLSVARSGTPRIVDEQGNTVLLRGANLNSLGDYFQDDPLLPPTKPPTEQDWADMAANGFSVVRLIVSWSKLEPVRGELDTAYLGQVQHAVEAAARHGMYTVIDVHQDAWGKGIATPERHVCPAGLEPAIGWDGAPAWATRTDGAETCRPPGNREGSAAVKAAFTNFYRNVDGIRDAYVATVGRVAKAFAAQRAVAGYDVFNEPNKVLPDDESVTAITELTNDLIAAIRAGEREAKGEAHLIFVEPIVTYPLPGSMLSDQLTDDPDIVFAPHNYAESIGPKVISLEQLFDAQAQTAADRGWPLWIGEYGAWAIDEANLDVLRRFAAAADAHLAGSAQWQWVQRCGDPHSIGIPNNPAVPTQYQLSIMACPQDKVSRRNQEFLSIAGRAYPRQAPGELTELTSDLTTRRLTVRGDATGAPKGRLVAWVPGVDPPQASGSGLTGIRRVRSTGGWYVTASPKGGRYTLRVTTL